MTAVPIQLSLFDAVVNVQLTQNMVAHVDPCNADFGLAKWYAWKGGRTFYACRENKGQKLYLHRLIFERKLGRVLHQSEQVDHIDGDGLNNRLSNLRLASVAQNMCNRGKPKNNTSGFKGVIPYRGRWRATIGFNRKTIYLGDFDTPELAHSAYCDASREYHGDFSRVT